MFLTESKKKEYIKKILTSRLRIINSHGFYGMLLMHMKFGIDERAETAYTDGYRICFGPEFLDSLNETETDLILMHEILHVVLKHCFRGRKLDSEKFNIACDIVVNSNILYANNMNLKSITVNNDVIMHQIKGKEGYLYTAEEVYNMLLNIPSKKNNNPLNGKNIALDDHTHWADNQDDFEYLEDEWDRRILQAMEALQISKSSKNRGDIPLGMLRMLNELKKPTINWRNLLADFLTFEINDYSFSPPDNRFSEFNFFLPDFNDAVENININILFEIDTSGSMSDDDILSAYSEIKGAIDYSNGKLKGWLGFYDSKAFDIKPFETTSDLIKIKPIGGGGTSCSVVFKNIDYFENVIGDKIGAIIIITDGYDIFPNEKVRRNIPVFWIITNDEQTPPWGVVARIKNK